MIDVLAIIVIACGAPMGSFLAAEAERVCAGARMRARSQCAECGERLGVVDLVPILSWCLYGAKARCCGRAIPARYVVIETLGLVAGLAAALVAVSGLQMVLIAVFLWLCIGLAASDAACFRLPDPLTFALAAVGLGIAWEDPSYGISHGVAAGAIALLCFLGLRYGYWLWRGREGLGLGDVKLAFGLGAGLGLQGFSLACLAASLAAIFVAMFQTRDGPAGLQQIPFGLYLCAAGATVMIAVLAI